MRNHDRPAVRQVTSAGIFRMMRVFLTHNPEDREAYYGRALPQLEAIVEVVVNPTDHDLDTRQLISAAADCEVIISHRSAHGPAAVFHDSPRLMAFLRCAVDIADIDVSAANAAGVLVARADKSFVASTAELALGLMLDVARNISQSALDYRTGREPLQRPGVQLRGRTAGIIGYGAIGSYLAGILEAIGMKVIVYDPFLGDATITTVGLEELLAESDFVLPLATAKADTENLIDAAALTTMKPGAFLVNVSRGELLDEAAVSAALGSGKLAGLAMDVGRAPDQRPTPQLASRRGVVATPHLGGLTPANADAQAYSSVEQVRAILDGQMPPRAVNPEAATRLAAYWAG
jgi:D-3-phosphoglycerate dehydrogenase